VKKETILIKIVNNAGLAVVVALLVNGQLRTQLRSAHLVILATL